MTDASLALRGAAFALLSGDADLVALTGAQRIHDGAPRGAAFPHLVIGAIESRPLLALAEDGEEHRLDLAVFSRADSRDEASRILSRAVSLLADRAGVAAALATQASGHALVATRLVERRIERLPQARLWRARARLRLVTEPLG
ncbi:MAG: hypothetical protein CMN87_19870 [Stappia sp.]|uniref:DUF3168 domain-containing protein n=1 Tax=Stappia sp. TaxID=1870903 RepID=UPI000C559F9A|nr:DUF3168 domain-containing protein [Stappia sp.]MAB01109.1 hypothetical protein [Stappia sp.]MBM22266.1 hypothetical protein [Stappia sp.]